jgi:acyl carrier protein
VDTAATIRDVLSKVLQRPVGPEENVSRENEPKWDSLKHVEIMFAIEDACNVRFSAEELAALRDVQALVTAVDNYRES